ncbi:MAG: hypothetical protein SangKO_031380 [Sandaracinaceae bacterium]
MARPVILCVDDERTVLTSLKEEILRRFGRDVIIELAESGEDALEVVTELVDNGDDLAVVVSDHIMPGMKGDDLLTRVHGQLPEVRTIMLTGQASPEAVGRAVNAAGLYRYLQKPWDADDLELTLKSALASLAGDRAREEQEAMLREMAEVSLALTANLAAGDRYARLVESARRVLRADRAVVFRVDGEHLRPLAASHPGPESCSFADCPELAGDLGAKEPVRRTGSKATALSVAAIGWPGRDRSLVSTPLRVGEEVVGLLMVGSDRPDAQRSLSDERVLTFSALAAASIRTTELVDALEESSEQRRRVAVELQRQASERGSGALLGNSAPIRDLRRDIALHAQSAGHAMVIGPPGAGCETVARALHEQREGTGGPFIVVEAMLVRSADDLFGADPQAVSDQKVRRAGTLTLARGGTLYLTGVDNLNPRLQAELAARLEAGADAQVIGSIRRDPGTGMDEALLRVLGTRRLYVPALRDRLDDLPELSAHFLAMHSRRTGRGVERLSEDSIARMAGYAWPGNVRELSHVIERAVVTASGPVAEVPKSLHEGFSIGSYQLTEKLGAGGMGEVWRAHHMHLSRPAAVKLIRDDRMFGGGLTERFRREAAATADLRSPHTVELYDFGVTPEGELYLVMELLDGMDLQTLVERYGPLPPERAVYLVRQACLSLGEAHAAGLVHRDVKPANLFVCQLGLEHDFLKLLDFGMVSAQEGDLALTQDGQIAGTPAFMAPEAGLSQEIDGRADLYSLGCVLHWLLTGRFVFETSNVMQQLMAHVSEPPPPPSSVSGHEVPPALDEIVKRCLSKEPSNRYADALELYDALGAVELERSWERALAQQWWSSMRVGSLKPAAPRRAPQHTMPVTAPDRRGKR